MSTDQRDGERFRWILKQLDADGDDYPDAGTIGHLIDSVPTDEWRSWIDTQIAIESMTKARGI